MVMAPRPAKAGLSHVGPQLTSAKQVPVGAEWGEGVFALRGIEAGGLGRGQRNSTRRRYLMGVSTRKSDYEGSDKRPQPWFAVLWSKRRSWGNG